MKALKKVASILFLATVVFSVMACLTLTGFAAEAPANTNDIAAQEKAPVADMGPAFAYIAAALSTGLGAIGAGIAVGAGAPAAIGALTEDPKSFGKALIFVALGEGIALYGMLISILILNKV